MNKKIKILFIDDDQNLTTVVAHQLQSMHFAVTIANSGQAGLDRFNELLPDVVLLDLQMPDMHGLEVLKRIRSINSQVPVIIGTAYGTVENAVEACRKGADDYLTKPYAKEQLSFAIEKALRLKILERENKRLQSELEAKYQFGNIITKSKKMHVLLELAGRAAQSDASVLIIGESGTGKELFAKAIHLNSPRKNKPFVAVNCPSIPDTLIESELFGHEKGAFTGATSAKPGKFELANGGTILLDEVGDLKLDLQAKLLRILQEHEVERIGSIKPVPVDVRIIAATNQNLDNLLKSGEFREDLFYRLNVIPLHLPPLRERLEDIPLLTEFFASKYKKRALKIDSGFYSKLVNYSWPGNVRELENIVQRAVILCTGDKLTADCLSFDDMYETKYEQNSQLTMADAERQAIVNALHKTNGNQSQAAHILKIPRHVLIYRMKKLKIVKA
jgi:two-component system response regulator AtoC